MTTNVPALNLSDEELMRMTGQGQAPRPALPRMRINRDATDENDNALPVGTFAVSQGDNQVFAKTAIFRPFINVFQYSLYDPNLKKTVNKSILFKEWRDEAIDELGGVRCGKIPVKKASDLSESAKAKNDLIKCYRFLFGTVTLKGKTQTGEDAELVNLPVKMKLRGSNFMPIGKALDAVTALKRPCFKHNFNLSLKKEKNGATTFYVMTADPDLKQVLPLTQEDTETWNTFQALIDRENHFVTEKYREALKQKAVPFDTDREQVINSLSGDLNDDVSDIGR